MTNAERGALIQNIGVYVRQIYKDFINKALALGFTPKELARAITRHEGLTRSAQIELTRQIDRIA